MKSKAHLVARARATARRPQPSRLAGRAKRGYRVISISLYSDQAEAVDHLCAQLQAAGFPKASRSLVIQEAIACLSGQLQARGRRSIDEVASYFREESMERLAESS